MIESRELRLGRLAFGYGEPYTFHRWPAVHSWPGEEILLALYWRKRFVALYWLDKEAHEHTR